MKGEKYEVAILGGGVAGLSAGYVLSKAGVNLAVCESGAAVGGLSRTIVQGEFRFDLGGHRFFTKNRKLENFVRQLMGEEFIVAPRKSRIYLRSRYFDYPLKPLNALFGMGILKSIKIISDCCFKRLKNLLTKPAIISLEDWVVSNFGREMFNLYFREYSEKVWGISCKRISEEWVAQRIRGLSLTVAIKNAFFKSNEIATLIERFLYPPLGIGRISEKMQEEIEKSNRVFLNTRAERANHSSTRINSIVANGITLEAEEFISSIPLTALVKMLHPAPPKEVLESAEKLRYRDTIIVAVMLNRDRITDLTWIYFPERKIPFGRIHEPKNWSIKMAPEGKTALVAEYFCFKGDKTWEASDEKLAEVTIQNLEKLGFIKRSEVIGSTVVRVEKAYPLLEIGYREHYDRIFDYLSRFKNLQIIGRGGMFRYHNMDHAIETGIKAAENIRRGEKT